MDATSIENLEQQLHALYSERELLEAKIGCSSAEDICRLIGELKAQVISSQIQPAAATSTNTTINGTLGLIEQIEQISAALGEHYTDRSITLTIEDGKPVLRAVWRDAVNGTANGSIA